MNTDEFDQFLKKHNACPEGYAFVKGCTLEEAIAKLDRQDWLMWVLCRLGLKKEVYVKIAIACAECLHQNEVGIKAIESAKGWLLNPCEETAATARAAYAVAHAAAGAHAAAYDAAYGAYTAAYDTTAYGAYTAAYIAAYGAYGAYIAAYGVYIAAHEANYAAHAAYDAADEATKKKIISEIKRVYKESL